MQIIRDTFLAYFRPPSPMCHLVTLACPSLFKGFLVKFSSKMEERMTRNILVDPLPLCHLVSLSRRPYSLTEYLYGH
jgi:hypothetical protein